MEYAGYVYDMTSSEQMRNTDWSKDHMHSTTIVYLILRREWIMTI